MSTVLTVVLITRNQAWNVRRLVESVLADCPAAPATEVVLVDSASSDATVALASAYPITVLSLAPDQRLTAAAGRQIGLQHASSPYVLFLDGDMELVPGWLPVALEHAQADERIAAITGRIVDVSRHDPARVRSRTPAAVAERELTDVRQCGGAALYPRSAVESVGGFNPYVYSDEEPELCLRLRNAGFRIVRLERAVVRHYVAEDGGISTILARRRRRLYLGAGQNLRYLLGRETFWAYVRERGFGLATAAALCVWIVACALALASGHPLLTAAAVALPLGFFALLAARRGLRGAARIAVMRLATLDGTVRGFLLPRLDPIQHPIRFEVVRHGGQHAQARPDSPGEQRGGAQPPARLQRGT